MLSCLTWRACGASHFVGIRSLRNAMGAVTANWFFFNAYWNRQLDFNHVEGLIQRLSEHDECVETDAYGPYQACLRLIEDGIYVTE